MHCKRLQDSQSATGVPLCPPMILPHIYIYIYFSCIPRLWRISICVKVVDETSNPRLVWVTISQGSIKRKKKSHVYTFESHLAGGVPCRGPHRQIPIPRLRLGAIPLWSAACQHSSSFKIDIKFFRPIGVPPKKRNWTFWRDLLRNEMS